MVDHTSDRSRSPRRNHAIEGPSTGPDGLLSNGVKMLVEHVEDQWNKITKQTVELAAPDEIETAFREAGCGFELDEGKALDDDGVLDAMQLALRFAVKPNHPRFFNQLYGRVEPVGLLGQWLSTATGANAHTYEVAPVFMLTEKHVFDKLKQVVGYAETADGLTTPGGSISNMYAMHLARFKAYPNMKEDGMFGCQPLVYFVSTHAHYSFDKNAHTMGFGTKNLVKIPTDRAGRMNLDALKQAIADAIESGKKPVFVAGTCGTTVTGAYDNLVELRKICDAFGMWLHGDGAWGGSAILASDKELRASLSGLEATDSCSWNPNKLMGIPLQCCAFLVRQVGLLDSCTRFHAPYLFQPEKQFSHLDVGDKTIQCSRMPDSFKLWLAWRRIGDAGWAQRIDKAAHLTRHMQAKLSATHYKGRFKIVIPASYTNLCFWYFPAGMGDFDPHLEPLGSERWKELHAVAPRIKSKMQKQGKALIGFTSIKLEGETVPNFWRMIVSSAWSLCETDMEETLDDIDAIGS